MLLLVEGLGRSISVVVDELFCKSEFCGLDANEGAVVLTDVYLDSKYTLFVAGIKPWIGGGIKTRNGGLEDSRLLGEGSRKAKG